MDPLTAACNLGTAILTFMSLPENAELRKANADLIGKLIGLFNKAHDKQTADKP
jgi:hypothetical protein